MKTIVVYSSNTGFTERYALGLSKRLGCPCVPLKKFDKAGLHAYDRVVFGGWVMGGTITGLEKRGDDGRPSRGRAAQLRFAVGPDASDALRVPTCGDSLKYPLTWKR
ncbi:hypothetical protein GMI70_00660 [Eggerthellaceae bacterium zg-893]|nr:hypothetical protein [Eggerthellaceae bacterium zg-893]